MSMIITAQQRGDNNYASAVRRALGSVCKYPLPIRTKDEALSLIGVGPSLAETIMRLLGAPSASSASTSAAATSAPKAKAKQPRQAKAKSSRAYSPKAGSGPWCLLLALSTLTEQRIGRGVEREALQQCMASIYTQLAAAKGGEASAAASASSGTAHAKKAWAASLRALAAKGLLESESASRGGGGGRPGGGRRAKRFATARVTVEITAPGVACARGLAASVVAAGVTLADAAAAQSASGGGGAAPPPQRRRLAPASATAPAASSSASAAVHDDADTDLEDGAGGAMEEAEEVEDDDVIDLATSPVPPTAAGLSAAPPRRRRRAAAPAAAPTVSLSASLLQAEQKRRDAWEVVLIVDQREVRSRRDRDYLRARLLEANVACEVRQLDLGDMLWIARKRNVNGGAASSTATTTAAARGRELERRRDGEIMIGHIVERKKVSDLAASIVGRRYKDQKRRLKELDTVCSADTPWSVLYLVEGALHDQDMLAPAVLQSALHSTQAGGFAVHRTHHIDDSIAFLAAMHVAIEAKFHRAPRRGALWPNVTFGAFRAAAKLERERTVGEIFGSQLVQVDGCSAAKADCIRSFFPTLGALLAAPRAERATLATKKRECDARSVGPKLAGRINAFYFNVAIS